MGKPLQGSSTCWFSKPLHFSRCMAGASPRVSGGFPGRCIRARFILRCAGLSSRAGSRQSGENQKITGAQVLFRSHAIGTDYLRRQAHWNRLSFAIDLVLEA